MLNAGVFALMCKSERDQGSRSLLIIAFYLKLQKVRSSEAREENAASLTFHTVSAILPNSNEANVCFLEF